MNIRAWYMHMNTLKIQHKTDFWKFETCTSLKQNLNCSKRFPTFSQSQNVYYILHDFIILHQVFVCFVTAFKKPNQEDLQDDNITLIQYVLMYLIQSDAVFILN